MERPDRNLPGTGTDDDRDVGTDPRRTREQEENERSPRQPPRPNQRPDQTPKTA